jgi:hypothetical protein
MAAPQSRQNLNRGGLAILHAGQRAVNGVLHSLQHFRPSELSKPQLGQRIGLLRGGNHAPETDTVWVNDGSCGTIGKSSLVRTPEPATSQAKFPARR